MIVAHAMDYWFLLEPVKFVVLTNKKDLKNPLGSLKFTLLNGEQ